MFNQLNEKINHAFHTLKGYGSITEINIAESLKEIRKALLEADVSYKITKEFIDSIKTKSLGQKVLSHLKPKELIFKIVHEELIELMGGKQTSQTLIKQNSTILLAGLQGSGKTTFSVKLAKFLQKYQDSNPLIIACDIYRPAAIEQLYILGKKHDIAIYSDIKSKDPIKIAERGKEFAKKNNHKTIIIDTAGRLTVDDFMMNEIKQIQKTVKPEETLFIIDAMTGQDAINTSKAFKDTIHIDGIIITKMDGDTKGGVALSVKSTIEKPIKFIGTGEKAQDIDYFYPDRMADRIMGKGDIVSLVEKIQSEYDEKETQKLQKKILKNQFDYADFISQIQQLKKIGNMKNLIGMLPGASKLKDIDIDENAFKNIEAIINSMTPKEKHLQASIDHSHKLRLSKGSGTSLKEVNKLIKQFSQMSKMMKGMKSGQQNFANLMNPFS